MTGLSEELCYDDVSLSSGEYYNPIGISLYSTRGGTCYDNLYSPHSPNRNYYWVYHYGYESKGYSTIRVAQNAQ